MFTSTLVLCCIYLHKWLNYITLHSKTLSCEMWRVEVYNQNPNHYKIGKKYWFKGIVKNVVHANSGATVYFDTL